MGRLPQGWPRTLAAALLACALGACGSVSYYAQSVGGHIDLLARARPIDGLIASSAITEERRAKLALVRSIRHFAGARLGLPENASYRHFADIGRDAVVWSVVATPEFALQPRSWCYPVIGCAAYRGYFARADALAESRRLAQLGDDVAVLAVPAYSTLGWTPDPVPSTVIDWPAWRVADLLFHELAHQRVYAANDSAFNESYATLVAREGVRRWLRTQEQPAWQAAWEVAGARRAAFLQLVSGARTELARLYASGLPAARMRIAKAALFERFRGRHARLKAQWGGDAGYDQWFDKGLNNARFASVATYHRWVPALRVLLDSVGGDMRALHAAAAELAALGPQARRARLAALLSAD